MERATSILEERFGWIINYEDPPYLFEGDIEDVTVARRDGDYSKKVFVPRANPFQLHLAKDADQPSVVFAELARAYVASGNTAGFRIVPGESATFGKLSVPVFYAVPTSARNHQGEIIPHTPVMDTRVSLPNGTRSASDFLRKIANAVTTGSGVKVVPGMFPTNFFFQRQVTTEAQQEPARFVLSRVLSSTGKPLSWKMRFDPTMQTYFISVDFVGHWQRGN